MKVRNNSGFMF